MAQIDELTIVGGSPTSKVGTKGYIRNYQGHIDSTSSYQVQLAKPGGPLLPSADGPACASFQQKLDFNPNPLFPQLTAAPGDFIQGTYSDNGHVSLPPTPESESGIAYWYGSANGSTVPPLSEVIKWTKDGKGGDGNGRLLAGPDNYDDGVCAEGNGSPIAQQRHAPPGPGILCKNSFSLPEDLPDGSTYTVYWVWDFSLHFGPKFKAEKGHVEWYTSCADIKISRGAGAGADPKAPPGRRARRRALRV